MLWAGFFLMIILGFVALGIDIAKLTATRTQLQNAADAAALAGASAVDEETGGLNADSATVRAQFTAAQNLAFVGTPEPVVLQASDVVFPSYNEIRVTVRREAGVGGEIVTHVAGVLGIKGLESKATASARAEPTRTVFCGLVPLWASPPQGETEFKTGCGEAYALKVGGGSGNEGNYGPLTLPQCSGGECGAGGELGASTYRCLLENGYCCDVSVGDVLTTEPGNMSAPTTRAIETRFNRDSDGRRNICYAEYSGDGGRVVMVPVTTTSGAGRSQVTVAGFAAFFLHDIPGEGNDNEIRGEFLHYVVPGAVRDQAPPPTSGTAVSVHLVPNDPSGLPTR